MNFLTSACETDGLVFRAAFSNIEEVNDSDVGAAASFCQKVVVITLRCRIHANATNNYYSANIYIIENIKMALPKIICVFFISTRILHSSYNMILFYALLLVIYFR